MLLFPHGSGPGNAERYGQEYLSFWMTLNGIVERPSESLETGWAVYAGRACKAFKSCRAGYGNLMQSN